MQDRDNGCKQQYMSNCCGFGNFFFMLNFYFILKIEISSGYIKYKCVKGKKKENFRNNQKDFQRFVLIGEDNFLNM